MKEEEVKIIECIEFELCLNDGTKYKVICSSDEMDKLESLIDAEKILYIDDEV